MKLFPSILSIIVLLASALPVHVGFAAQPTILPAVTGSDYKITVTTEGIHRIDYASLLAAGLPVDTLDPTTFQVFVGGSEVAIFVSGEADHHFNSTDYILFYGIPANTLYSGENIYWLVFGKAAGLRMTERNVTPSGGSTPNAFPLVKRFEDNKIYDSKIPSVEGGDHWYGLETFFILCQNNVCPSQTYTYTLNLSNFASGSYPASLKVALRGAWLTPFIDPDHSVKVSINGTLLGTVTWDGYDLSSGVLPVDQSILQSTNVLSITASVVPGAVQDQIYTDWFELTYFDVPTAHNNVARCDAPSAGTFHFNIPNFTSSDIQSFDFTDPSHPILLKNGQVSGSAGSYTLNFTDSRAASSTKCISVAGSGYLTPSQIIADTPSNLKSVQPGAVYVVITHSDFLAQATQLASYRASHNAYSTKVVDVQDIYDEFSYGLMSQQAIKDFLTYAYNNWTTRPQFVVLMGDGHYDPRNYTGSTEKVLIPPFLAIADSFMGETAADNRYVDVNNDQMPDMHLGRFPVNTVAQAQEMVSRVISYEAQTPDQTWNRKVIFVSDDADAAGNFPEHSNLVADSILPATYTAVKMYFRVNFASATTLRTTLVSNINQGALFVNYNGHSAIQNWGGERFLRATDIATLTNAGRYPVMIPMTCLEGHYIVPGFPSVGETVVRTVGRGAIASWAPTGLGVATGHTEMYTGFYDAIFQKGIFQLGPATTEGKKKLFQSNSQFKELLDTYVLFGDPALTLAVPAADLAIHKTVEPAGPVTPGQLITYTVTVSNTGQLAADSVVVSDTLPVGIQGVSWSASNPDTSLIVGSNLKWQIVSLAPSTTRTIQIRATVGTSALTTGWLTNTVQITGSSPDRWLGNNQAKVTSPVIASNFVDLGGFVWADMNGNRLVDDNPTVGLPGMPIVISTANGQPVTTALTDNTGHWRVNHLPSGNYRVSITIHQGFVLTTPALITLSTSPGVNKLDLNFGFVAPTSVALTSFVAQLQPDGVQIQWHTTSEFTSIYFNVYNVDDKNGVRRLVNSLPLPSNGSDSDYTVFDSKGSAQSVYWLEAVDQNSSVLYGPVSVISRNFVHVFLPVARR